MESYWIYEGKNPFSWKIISFAVSEAALITSSGNPARSALFSTISLNLLISASTLSPKLSDSTDISSFILRSFSLSVH